MKKVKILAFLQKLITLSMTTFVLPTKSGAKIEDGTQWLKSNISKKIINYGDIWLYVWMGTCNLTSKNKKYISLKSENDEEVDKLYLNIMKL